jgi:enoyl-CoA hydratase/carnithine racemase
MFTRRLFSVSADLVLVQTSAAPRVALVTLNRPKALNALCDPLIHQLNESLKKLDSDPNVGAIVLTGSGRAFAAGADLKEMGAREDFAAVVNDNMLSHWDEISRIRKPILAAVNGYALGGGCELAMLCDLILAADNAQFGQPEVKVGTIPGCGGTQRLIRSVGKSKAMQMILTGEPVSAVEAERMGLVAQVVPADKLIDTVLNMASKIASLSNPVVMLAKQAVNAAYEGTLAQGVDYEKKVFHSTWGLTDRKEGMRAFAEKRAPVWTHH